MKFNFDLKLFIAGILFANHLLIPATAFSQVKMSDSSEKVLMPIGMDVQTDAELLKWKPSNVIEMFEGTDTSVRFALENYREVDLSNLQVSDSVFNNNQINEASIKTLSPVVDQELLQEHRVAQMLMGAKSVYNSQLSFDPSAGVVYRVGFVNSKNKKIEFTFKSTKYIQIASQWIDTAFAVKSKEPGRKRAAVGRAILRFPGESAMFFIALGFGAYTQLLTNYSNNPIALQQHVESLRDPLTHAAFAAFMAANAYTNEALMRSALAKSKMRFMIPYLGMTSGLMADRTLRDLVAFTQDKDMAICIDHITGKNSDKMFATQKHPCDTSYQKWVLDKRHEYGPALASLFISNYLAGQGEMLVRQAGGKIAQQVGQAKILSNGVKFSGLMLSNNVSELMNSTKALSMAATVATKAGSISYQGAKMLVSGVIHIGRLYAFTQLDHLIMPYVNEVWMNSVQPGEIEEKMNAIVASIKEKEKSGWKGHENNRECKTIKSSYYSHKDGAVGYGQKKCESDLNVLVSDFAERMAKWRTFNLEKVEMARLNWFEKVKSSHDMMTVSEEFYNFYLEQYLKLNDNDGKQKKLLISHYPLHGVSPTMNVDLFPLVAKLDNSVTSSHIPYIFNFTDDDINEINSLRSENNLNSLKEANSYGSTLKSSQAKKSKELQDIYLLNTDQFLFDQAQSMLQNLTQFFASQSQLVKTLSPELQKIVFGWKQKIENFKQKDIYLNKPMMVDGPKVSLEKIEKILGPIAYEISYYRDYYFKQLSRLPNPQPELVKNYSVFATISRSIGHPEPAMGIGEGFVAAFKANSVKGKNLNQILYPASNGAFDTKTWLEFLSGKAPVKSSVLDFLVVQMACGPDIESGQFIKDNWLAQGGRVEFVAPRLTNGDRPELCEYNYTGTNRPTTDIYRATFKVKNSKGQMVHYKGLLDYVNKNLRQDFIPYMIDDKNSEKSEKVIVQPFIQKWDQMVLPVFAQKIKDLEKDYDEVVTLLNKTIQSTNQYPLNNSRLANSPLKNIEQELVTYQTLLTHITKSLNFGTEDRVQGMNNKLATSYSFDSIRSITDPVMFKFQQDIYNSFYSVTNEVRTQLNIKNKRQTVEQMQEKINGINSVIDQAIVKISQKAKPILDPQLQAEAQKSIDEIDQQIQELKDEGASLYDDSDKGIAYLETIREMKSAYLKQNAFSTLTQVEARTLDENQYKVLVAGIILEKMKTLAGELGLYFVTINNMKLDKNLTARLSQNDTNLDCSTIDPSSMLWHNSCRLDK